jgi:predicted solute-binding protein
MTQPRISASAYSNTAPLVWSFLYGLNHGKVELILDNAPARSAQLLADDRVDAALVPVIAFQQIDHVKLISDVCIGAKDRVRSVCLVSDGRELNDVRSVALDISSKTSVVLTKIIFREFLGFEPEWREAEPELDSMLAVCDAALIIGDPALTLSTGTLVHTRVSARTFDLAELWHRYTGLGFVFAMWMTKKDEINIDFAAARDEGLEHLDGIVANYSNLGLNDSEMRVYLSHNISYTIDESMRKGMELYFELAAKHELIDANRPIEFI